MNDYLASSRSLRRLGLVFFLNATFTIIAFVGGWLTNSTAILADAIHDLGDSMAIGLAWLLAKLGEKKANSRFSYGYRRFSLLGALVNGLILIAGSIWILSEAISRLADPPMPMAEGMIILAILGIGFNGYAALKLSAGQTLNERVLNWHLLEDVLGWMAVLVTAIILLFAEWPLLDPMLSIGLALFILLNVGRNLLSTAHLFLQGVPDSDLYEDIRRQLESFDFIDDVHHIHLWSLDGERHVLTAHIQLTGPAQHGDLKTLKKKVAERLKPFSITHSTIEFEFAGERCRDRI